MSWVLNASGASPVFDANYATDQYWFNGAEYATHAAFLTAIGGAFARADATTCATYFDSAGLLQTVAADVLRFDHDPETGTPEGILSERLKANYCLWPRDLTNAAWVASNMTVAKTATGIDGVGNSASTLTATAGNATLLQTLTRSSAQRITGCRIKRRTGSGTINMTQDNGVTWTAVTVTSAWTRVNVPAATLANPILGFRIVTSGDAIDVDYVQHEEAAFLSSDIATTTAAVTRAADFLTAGPTGGLPFTGFSAAAGSLVVHGRYSGNPGDGNAQGIVAFDDGTISNDIYFQCNGASENHFLIDRGGVSQANLTVDAAVVANALFRCAAAWSADDIAAVANGGTVQTDPSATLPSGLNVMRIGNRPAAGIGIQGHISRVAYFASRISNVDLANFTNWKQTDTRNKRSSAIMISLPWRGQLPAPDGTINQPDRQQTGLLYAGTLAAGSGRASDRGLLRPPGRMIH